MRFMPMPSILHLHHLLLLMPYENIALVFVVVAVVKLEMNSQQQQHNAEFPIRLPPLSGKGVEEEEENEEKLNA